jgi:hypothetical protein
MRQQWADYYNLADRVLKLAERSNSNPRTQQLVRNLATRVRIIEIELEIEMEDSIVREFVENIKH